MTVQELGKRIYSLCERIYAQDPSIEVSCDEDYCTIHVQSDGKTHKITIETEKE
jgi:hypothetical protein